MFEALRVLLDRPDNRARFLLLGSASPALSKDVSESLAGRIGFVDLSGFDLPEIGVEQWRSLWLRGGFPRSWLAASDSASMRWRDAFARTFLERDIPQFGIRVASEALRRFWSMVAHNHGQTWNAAEFARSLGASEAIARHYLDLLAGAYMVRALPPWFENLKKRQVRAPKVYVRDTGLLHSLLGIEDDVRLGGHPKVGASFEGFCVEQLSTLLGTRDLCFRGTHAGAELDLMAIVRGRRFGFEFKLGEAPGMTRSIGVAMADLKLERAFIVYPGKATYSLSEQVCVVPVERLPELASDPNTFSP